VPSSPRRGSGMACRKVDRYQGADFASTRTNFSLLLRMQISPRRIRFCHLTLSFS
jgi:hypothetical protein